MGLLILSTGKTEISNTFSRYFFLVDVNVNAFD